MGMKMLSVVLAAIALGAVTAAPASAAPEGNPIIEISSVAHGQCLQPNPRDGLHELAACDDTPSQRFEQIPLGNDRHLLRNLGTRSCMDTTFGLWHDVCDDEAETTQFAELVPDVAGTVRIKFGQVYADTTEGVWTWEFADTNHQRWRVRQTGTAVPVDTAGQIVRIASVHDTSYGCVTPTGYSSSVYHQPCADVPEQKFQRIEIGGDTMLRNIASGKCVSAKHGGINAYEFDCDPADAQQLWTFEPVRTGDFRIRQSSDQRYLMPVGRELWINTRGSTYTTFESWTISVA
ncbi:RICIN domain-containing protein [Lentzea sp. NPDC102401]|uniref:RICIN domain-containing protein n=1 Tax=Lentzea sp. NPDC102401 TaxID=3364128 RepID=UPI00380CFF50